MWKPLLLLEALMILRELGGQNVVFSYTVYLFQLAGSTFDPFKCTILVGLTRLICTCIGAILMDKLGRRPLFLGTVFICVLSLTTAGVAIMIGKGSYMSGLVALGSVLIYVASYGSGVGPVPWTLLGELLPSPIRSMGSSLVTTGFSITVFGLSNIFPFLLNNLGLGITFIMFSVSNVLVGLIAYKFLPETKGKSLLELENAFGSKSSEYKTDVSTAAGSALITDV